jgi:putative ABC transport system permease protein
VIRHLLKLVWQRKRANALIMLEIFASFLIVFVLATLGFSLWWRWRAPLGFEWRNVWVMSVVSSVNRDKSTSHTGPKGDSLPPTDSAHQNAADVARVLQELKSFPQIEVAAADAMPPYSRREWTTSMDFEGRKMDVTGDQADDNFAKVMRLQVVRGRWFTREDEAQNYQAIVIDEDVAAGLFPGEDPIGKRLPNEARYIGDDAPKDARVVGVIARYRKSGEFTAAKTRMVFYRISERFPPMPTASQVVIRVKDGTPASFEAELNEKLRPSDTGAKYRVRRMDDMRRADVRLIVTTVIVLGVIALFLILMVALGLTGVLWQTVTRRTRELGLRRAVGASRVRVQKQVLGELALLVTLAVILGCLVIVQLPLLPGFGLARGADVAAGLATALAAIYGITLLCGAYPSWLASTIQPAEALHYE